MLRYDSLGRLERVVIVRSVDSSETIVDAYHYDGTRKTRVHSIPQGLPVNGNYAYGTEGSNSGYSAPGATRVTTLYDEQDKPSALLFHDDHDAVLSSVVFQYEGEGRLLEETQTNNVTGALPSSENLRPEQLDAMKSLLGNGVTRAYRYDSLGRMVEERFSMGMVGGHRTTITYNEHGDRSEETLYEDDRTIEIQNDGSVVDNSETSTKRTCELRHAYRYDDRGNWTERTSLRRIQADQPYTLCSREQRIIFYR